MKDPVLREAFEKVKSELAARGLTPTTPLKRKKETTMSENETPAETTEAPAKKTTLKKKSTAAPAKSAPAKKVAATKTPAVVDGYTATQFAADLSITPVELRKALRGIEAEKPGSRWVWPSKAKTADLAKQLKTWLAEDGRAGNSGRKPAAAPSAPAKKAAAKKTAPAAKKTLTKKAK